MILFCLASAASFAQSVTNSSFEADTFTIFPGYSSNNGPITGWTSTNSARTGLNPASGSPFANNGAIPDGSNVAFIQNTSGTTGTLSQTISGLTVGETYRISYSYNSRAGAQDSRLQATMGGTTLLQTPSTLFEVGGGNPYFYAGNEFTATGTSATLTFANINGAPDSTLLLDRVAIASASSDGLTTAAWTGNADSGVSSGWNYLAAANFGSGSNAVINGVTFAGAGTGPNPSGAGYFTSGLNNFVGNDPNNVTGAGASRVLANSFHFAGSTETVTFTGLTAGRQYVADIYTVGWDASTDQIRNQTISDGAGGTVTINPNVYGFDNGTRLSYTYTATGATQAFTFTQQNAGTFHNYGVANRQNFLAWDDGVGSWFTGANWDAENNATIPGAGVTAVIDNGGTAQVTGGTASAGRLEVGGASSGTLDFSAGTLDIPTINLAANGTFQASNTTTQSINSTITGTGNVTKIGTGTLNITNTDSTYTGVTTFDDGIVNVASVADYGVASSLGARTFAQEGGGNIGLLFRGGTLQYTGSTAQSTNRAIRVSTAGGATIDASGSNPAATLSFTATSSPDFWENPGNRQLTLTGTNTGDNIFAMAITQAGGTTSLTKNGSGTWVVSGANTFTGNVAVNDGTLATGGTNRYSFGANTVGRSVTVDGVSSVLDVRHTNAISIGHGNEHNITLIAQNGGTIRNSGTAVNRIGDLTLDGGNLEANVNNANWGSWYFGTRNGGQDATVTVGSSAASTISGSGNIALGANTQFNVADGAAAADLTVSTILTTGTSTGLAGGFTKLGTGTMALTAQSTHTGGTTVTGGTLDLVGQNILYGTGGLGNGSALTVDGGSSLVKLSATGINAMSNLGPLTLKNGGTFTDNGPAGGLHSVYAPVTFDGGGTMTSEVAGNGGFGNFLFINGITVTGTPGLATIDAHSISFNFSQTLNVADSVAGSGTDLLISSSIRNERVGTITKNGTGKVTLSGVNVDTSAWTINAGNLEVQNGSAIGDAAAVTVNSGGTFEVDNNETIGRIGGAGNVVLNANLTTGDTTNTEISGNISGSGTLIKQGASTLTLSGDNSAFSGGITVQNDNSRLALNSANAAGTGDLTFSGGTFLKFFNDASGPSTINNNLNTSGWFYWESGSKALDITGAWNNNSQVVWLNSANTLTISGVVSGTQSTGFYGGGTIALTNSNNNFTGNYHATLNSTIQFTTVADSGVNSALGAGTQIRFDAGNQSFNGYFENIGTGGSTNRAITIGRTSSARTAGIANNGTGALNFSGTFTNDAGGGGTRTLLLGGNFAGENTISSDVSDGAGGGKIALTKDGTTTWVLSGANSYTGKTTVTAGTLGVAGAYTPISSPSGEALLVSSGATMNIQSGGNYTLGSNGNWQTIDGTLNIETGGSYNDGTQFGMQVGTAGNTGALNINGGTMTVSSAPLKVANGGTGDLTVSSGSLSVQTLKVAGDFAGGNATVHLDGGTLTAAQVDQGSGTATFNFNGGTLRASQSNAAFMTSGSITSNVEAGGAVIDSNGFNITIGQNLADAGGGGLTKNGAGTLTLSGVNSYTGDTNINAGVLELQSTSGFHSLSSDMNINNGSTLQFVNNGGNGYILDAADTINFDSNGGGLLDVVSGNFVVRGATITSAGGAENTIQGSFNMDAGDVIFNVAAGTDASALTVSAALTNSAGIVKQGTGTMVATNVTYTGATTVDGGVLVLDESDNTYNGGDININNGATLRLDNQTGIYLFGANQNFNFGASGGNTLEIVTGHNHVWSGNNTVTTNGGSENILSGSSINTNSGAAAGTLTFNVAAGSDASDLTVSSIIDNQGGVLKTGAGTLTFTSDMTYSGGTTVNGGELRLESGDATLNANSALTIDGATSVVRLGPTVTGNNIFGSGPLFIQNGGTMIDDTPTATVHSINGGLTFTNGGTLTSTGAGNGTFGNYFISGSTNVIVTGNAAATISAAAISINGPRSFDVDDVTGDTSADLTVSSVVKDWGTNSSQMTKLGAGTMELTAQNTYTGATTINDGTLILSGGTDRLSGGSAITVDGAGSTLSLQGAANNVIQSWNALNIQNGASVSDDTSINAVHSLGTVTFDNGGSLSSTGNGNGAFGNYLFVGGVNVTGTGLATVDAHSVSFNFAQTVTVADTVAGSGTDLLISSAITNADGRVGNVTKAGVGTLELTGTNTDTSNYFVRAGTLVGGNNSAFGTGTITLNDASTGANDTSLFLTPTFDINNNIVVANQGTGTVTIGANGTDATADATTFNGTLQLNRDTTLTGSADQTLFANQISGNVGTLTIARSPDLTGTASGRVTFANGITNTFVGDIDITSHAILQSNGADNIPDASNVNVQADGRFQLAFNNETINGLTGAGVVSFFPAGGYGATTLTVGAGNNPSADFAGTIQDAGGDAFSLAKTGTGTQILSGANTYSGGTTIAFNGGILELQHVSAAGTGTITQQDGNSWLVLNAAGTIANNFDIYRMRSLQNVELTGNITVNNATFDIAAPTVTTHSGDISGGGGVTKQGGGTLVLTGTNTYSGATTVEAGTLLINGDNSGALGAVTVEAGATLGGTGTIGGATTLAAGASLSPAGVDVGTLTLGGDLDIEQAVTAVDSDSMLFDLGSGVSGDLVDVNGTLNIGSGLLEWDDFNFTTTALQTGVPAYTLFSAASITGTLGSNVFGVLDGLFARLRLDGGSIFLDLDADVPFPGDPNFNQFDFIPEPSRAMLLLFGFSASVLRRRR